MNAKEVVPIRGVVRAILSCPGMEDEEIEVLNCVTDDGYAHAAGRMTASPPAPMNRIGVGSGTTPASRSQSGLQSEIFRKACSIGQVGNVTTLTVVFNPGEATGAITEAGVFNTDTLGTMFSRVVFSPRNKIAAATLTIVWSIIYG